MTYLTRGVALVAITVGAPGCNCANQRVAWNTDSSIDGSESTTGEESGTEDSWGQTSAEAPFDASRWLGRYHYENPFLPFGERGDPLGSPVLVNAEIFADGTVAVVFDHCNFDAPVTTEYTWTPGEPGWLDLGPVAGETSLRFMSTAEVTALRVRLTEPCRTLEFELDADAESVVPFFPGESCWVDRCSTPGLMQVDYCEDEQPAACP